MNAAHLHLLINHGPVFGSLFALALLVASYIWSPDVLRRTAFVVLIGTALISVASDLSGDPAAAVVRGLPGVKREMIRAHDAMAGKSMLVAGLTGVIALVFLVRARRVSVPASAAAASLILTVVVCGMMAYTALLGGEIRHTEIRPNATAADASAVEAAPPRPAR